MKKLIMLCLSIGLMAALAANASAADYTFRTVPETDYYKSTDYVDLYDSEYNYGGRNVIDFDIPEIRYGLAQEFLEHSLNNPYLGSGVQYGFQPSGAASYPKVEYDTVPVSTVTDPISIRYLPAVTVDQLKQADGSIGTVSISRVGLYAKVFEGATDASMAIGAGHFEASACWDGNVGLFGHNRGSSAYFGNLKDVKLGDRVTYTTNQGSRSYEVTYIGTIDYTDHSYLNGTGDNRITLITCIANQPSLRLCVQATEIH